jgi:hypothetical protein
MDKYMNRATLLCAAAFAGLASMTASATTVRVRVSPDAYVTYMRLQVAAGLACGMVNRSELPRYRALDKCYRTTLQDALEQMRDPMLLAIHRRQSGRAAG